MSEEHSAMKTLKTLTRIETVLVKIPGSSGEFHSMEPRPVFQGVWSDKWMEVAHNNTVNGDTITWYNNGDVILTKTDGTTKTWYSQPTLEDVILMPPHSGDYTQFKSTGEVICLLKDHVGWYWGIPNSIETDVLTISYYTLYKSYDDNYDNDDCGCHNDYRCCGWYPSYGRDD